MERFCSACSVKIVRSTSRFAQWKDVFCTNKCRLEYRGIKARARAKAIACTGLKSCSKCDTVKEIHEFFSDSRTVSGYSSWCRECHTASTKGAQRRRQERDPIRFREVAWHARLRRTYGLTLHQYKSMVAARGGKCDVCGRFCDESSKNESLHVDHCHDTGVICGLVCHSCNVAIGLMKEDPKIAMGAVRYLEAKASLQGAVLKLAEEGR